MKTLTHQFSLPMAAAAALPLFTPKGEEAWIPGWKPTYLEPESGDTARGMVFTTLDEGRQVVWTCLDYEPASGLARYFRVLPSVRASIVEVRCCPASDGETTVSVTYSHLALGVEGASEIDGITPAGFNNGIEDWRRLIVASGVITPAGA